MSEDITLMDLLLMLKQYDMIKQNIKNKKLLNTKIETLL